MNQPHSSAFLCRSALRSGESLASLLTRLADLNVYTSPHLVKTVIRERLEQRDDPAQPMLAATYQVLEQLTTLPAEALYQATAHPWARMMNRTDDDTPLVSLAEGVTEPVLSIWARKQHLRSWHDLCYCPHCLRAAAYHRLAWLPRATAVCLEHHCLLVQSCRQCHASLPVRAVVQGCCPQCHFDLTQAVTTDVIEDDFGLFVQTTLWRCLAEAAGCSDAASTTNGQPESWCRWADSLPPQPTAVLYQVVTGLQRSLCRVEPEWFHWHRLNGCFADGDNNGDAPLKPMTAARLTPLLAYNLYATAFKALVNWPQGFYEFLDAYGQRHGRQVTGRVAHDFGALYTRCLEKKWLSPDFHFVQVAFDRYLAHNYPLRPVLLYSCRYQRHPQLAAEFPYLSADEAAQRLQMHPHTLKRLVALGCLVTYTRQGEKPSAYQLSLLRRQEVLTLQSRWQRGLPPADVSQLLGVSEDILLDLVNSQMLTTVSHEDGNEAGKLFDQASVMALLDNLAFGTIAYWKLWPYTRSLSELAPILKRYGYRPTTVMQLAQARQIRFYWDQKPGPTCGQLCIATDDLDDCLEQLPGVRLFVSRLQFARLMGVNIATVMTWTNKGLISVVSEPGVGRQFDRAEVEAFMARYVLRHKVASLLAVPDYQVQRWLQDGRLSPVSGPAVDGCYRLLFARADIERLKAGRMFSKTMA